MPEIPPNRASDPQGWMKYRNEQFGPGLRKLGMIVTGIADSLESPDYDYVYDATVFVNLTAIMGQVAFMADFFNKEVNVLKDELANRQEVVPEVKIDVEALTEDIEKFLKENDK